MADEISKDADKIQSRSNDEELNALLDSALLDFDKGSIESKTKSTAANSDSNANADKSHNVSSTPENHEGQVGDMFGEDPLIKLMMSQFEQTFQSLLQEDGETEESTKEWAEVFRKDFKNLAEVTMKEVKDEASSDEPSNEFSSTIAETLKSLSENADNLQANGGDVMNMLGSLGLGGLGDGSLDNPGDFSSAFNNVMQMFLSKDVLYPALKQLVTKYPAWLEENQSTVSKDDYSRFSKQLEIMTKVCSEMESATDSDSEEVKSKRFSDILQLMHQMEEFGHPPKSLLGDSFDIPQWL